MSRGRHRPLRLLPRDRRRARSLRRVADRVDERRAYPWRLDARGRDQGGAPMKAMLLESTKIILDTDAGQITAVGLTADARRLLSTDGVLVDLAVSLLDEAIAP